MHPPLTSALLLHSQPHHRMRISERCISTARSTSPLRAQLSEMLLHCAITSCHRIPIHLQETHHRYTVDFITACLSLRDASTLHSHFVAVCQYPDDASPLHSITTTCPPQLPLLKFKSCFTSAHHRQLQNLHSQPCLSSSTQPLLLHLYPQSTSSASAQVELPDFEFTACFTTILCRRLRHSFPVNFYSVYLF